MKAPDQGRLQVGAEVPDRPATAPAVAAEPAVLAQPIGGALRRSATRTDPLGGSAIPGSVLSALQRRRGGGQPLPDEVAGPAGEALAHDLSGVRVHSDPEAHSIARSVQSVAFSYGSDIYFTSGSYRPGDPAGQHLLGHELAHVAQPASGSGVIGRADDPAEAAADRAATGVVTALRRRAANAAGPLGSGVVRRSPALVIRRLLDTPEKMELRYGVKDMVVPANEGLRDVFDNHEVGVKALIGTPTIPAKLKALRLFLYKVGMEAAEVSRRWLALTTINTYLGSAMYRLCRNDVSDYLTTDDLERLAVDINGTSAATRTLLRTLTGDNLAGANLQEALRPGTVTVPTLDWAVGVVDGAGGNTANRQLLSPDIREKLQQVYGLHPPMSAHPPMAWGTGNWGNIADNLEQHARKHLLRLGNADNPDRHEPYKWMARLGYTVKKDWIDGVLGVETLEPTPGKLFTDDQVQTEEQADYFFNTFLPANDSVVTAMLGLYQDAYRDNVVGAARDMAAPIVTADGGKVQIVGQHDELFIAGRWEGAGLGFTISSGYLNTTKWLANQPMKAWALT